MPTKSSILAFAGSLRKDSLNKKLVRIAAAGAEKAGAGVTLIDLADFPMPIYDGDIEARSGLPEHAKRLKALLKEHHGLLISSPEYNSSVSAALKNAIDWTSRAEGKEPAVAAFAGKVAGLVSASPSGLGGLRGLVHLRAILGNIQVLVLPDQVAINTAHEAFDASGNLIDPKKQAAVEAVGAKLAQVLTKLTA